MVNKKLRKLILKITPKKIQKLFVESILKDCRKIDLYGTLSYSQEGEDLILKRIFEKRNNGYYVDVGAHHPMRFSNTYIFYRSGWSGINIDAMPGSMKLFEHLRPKDINLELGISNNNEDLTYYQFNEPALNTFSRDEALKKNQLPDYEIIDELKMKTYRLSEILSTHLKSNQKIDFLNIDVEGLDMQVLKSNDWTIFKPEVILIEILNMSSIKDIKKSDIYVFLVTLGYSLYAKTANTCLFKI